MLTISVKGIDNAGETFSGKVSPDALGLNDFPLDDGLLFETPVEYTLHVSEVSGGILVAGTLSTKLKVSCCRCLEPFEYGFGFDDVCHFIENATTDIVDVGGDLREDILISLPVKFLCDDDCAGLCPVCGANLNKTKCSCDRSETTASSPWDALDQLC